MEYNFKIAKDKIKVCNLTQIDKNVVSQQVCSYRIYVYELLNMNKLLMRERMQVYINKHVR